MHAHTNSITHPRACMHTHTNTHTHTHTHLQPGVGVELIEEVHQEVYLEGADTQHHMFLRLGAVTAVVPTRLLSLHPQVGQLLKLTNSAQHRHTLLILLMLCKTNAQINQIG